MQATLKSFSLLSEKQASVISHVINPAFLPSVAAAMLMLLLGNTLPEEMRSFWVFLFISCFGTIFPVLIIVLMYWQGKVTDLNLYHRAERHIPLLAATVFVSYAAYFVSYQWNGGILGDALVATAACLVVMTIVTRFHKASLHSAGICGLVAVLIAARYVYDDEEIYWSIFFTAILAVLTMAARLKLKAHTLLEVITGAIIGFGTCFFVMCYLH